MSKRLLKKLRREENTSVFRTAWTNVVQDPAHNLKILREYCSNENIDIKPELEAFMEYVAKNFHDVMVFDERDQDPEVVWQYLRLLHRRGKPEDALTYARIAIDLDPTNSKYAARHAEILLDIHSEIPSLNTNMEALLAAHEAYDLEPSEYTAKLLEKARNTTTQEEIEAYFYDPKSPIADEFSPTQPI